MIEYKGRLLDPSFFAKTNPNMASVQSDAQNLIYSGGTKNKATKAK